MRDLLDTAGLEQGHFVLDHRPVDLVDLARLTAAEFDPTPGAVHVEAPMEELIVSAEESRLRQLIENLLSNALKVQPEHEPVVMTLEADGTSAILKISDRGPGIAADTLPNLFQRFGAGAGSVGLGLGLCRARGVAEAHGGSLEVESQFGQGACFTVRLPLDRWCPRRPWGEADQPQRNGHTRHPTMANGGRRRT